MSHLKEFNIQEYGKIPIFEPCNYASNLAYYYTVIEICTRKSWTIATEHGTSVITSTYSGTGALTLTNAIAAVDNMIQTAIVNQPDILSEELILLMGYADFQTLTFALRAYNQFHITWGADVNTWDFIYPGSPNVRVVASRGFNYVKGTMILTPRQNIAFGTDLISDSSNFNMYFDFPTKTIMTRIAWKQGIQVAYPQYIIYKRK